MGIHLKHLQPRQEAKLYTRIASVMFMFKRYPSKQEYNSVARQLLEKYPFLASPLAIDSTGHILKSLQDRFREFRRTKPSIKQQQNVEFSFTSKRGRKPARSESKSKKTRLEVLPHGEDHTSFIRHNKLLLLEYKKVHPNKLVVTEAMRLSFEMRRNDILTNIKPVKQILAEYPFLGDRDELLTEMSRIMPNTAISETTDWTNKWIPRLLVLCAKNLVGEVQQKAVQLMQSKGIDERISIDMLPLLPLLIPDHKIKPVIEKLVIFISGSLQASVAASEMPYNTPTLIIKENDSNVEAFLAVEKIVLCKIPPLLAPVYLISAYYVFDIEYPKGLRSLYLLLEKVLFNKKNEKVPQIVHRIFSALMNSTE